MTDNNEQTWTEVQPEVNAEDAQNVPDAADAVHQFESNDDYRARLYYEASTEHWHMEIDHLENGEWDTFGQGDRDSWEAILDVAYQDPADVERPQVAPSS
jgi:hypothetical protein